MAGQRYVQCVGPSYHLADRKASIQSSINCYPKKLDNDRYILRSVEGATSLANIGAEIRGEQVIGSRWFLVAGAQLLEMRDDGSYTVLGALSTTSGPVSMDYTETQLAIVDGPYLYILNLSSNNFVGVGGTGWRGSNTVTALDGYFIFHAPDTDQYYITAIDDGTSLDAIDFTSADAAADKIVAVASNHRQLWVLGEISSEIWVNSGTASFPFTRYNSYPIDIGCVGPHAFVAKAADTIFFVGKTKTGTGVVYMVEGNLPKPVSNSAVEETLRASTNIAGVRMWSYQIDGHDFVGVSIPGAKTTWVYDARSQLWHERGEYNVDWQPLRWTTVSSVGTKHYVGDINGNVSLLDQDVNQISGRHLVRERTWPHMVAPTAEPVSYKGLELLCKTGSGGTITLEISNDGGENFGPKLLRDLGAIGRWMQRIRWVRLGTSRNRVFRIRCSDNVPFSIYDAVVDV